jgi:hypothetical protein
MKKSGRKRVFACTSSSCRNSAFDAEPGAKRFAPADALRPSASAVRSQKENLLKTQDPQLSSLVGMPVSHVWFGHSSSLILELGALSEYVRPDGEIGSPVGIVTILVHFGWRIEGPRAIAGQSGESHRRQASVTQRLIGAEISEAETVGRIPELQLDLSNKLRLVTFTQEVGQPKWAVLFNQPQRAAIWVKGGRLHAETHLE